MSRSISFDRAVEYYDRTRALSESASGRVTEQLAGELRGRGPCLEIGAGTGLVSLPLAAAGIPLVGLDLSAVMLAKLVEKAGRRPFPLVVGDATALPFSDRAFGGAVIRHVLHLIAEWELAVAELARVVGRPGIVLVAVGDIPPAWREIASRFAELAHRPSLAIGLDLGTSLAELDAAFLALGSDRPRELPPVLDEARQSLAEYLDQMADGLHSWTWDVSEEERRRIVEDLRRWASDRFGTLDPPEARRIRVAWRVYDLG